MSRSRAFAILFALFAAAAGGCRERLPVDYAPVVGNSVNGLRVFADMLRARGHRVRVERGLSPRLEENADVIVLADPEFYPLPAASRDFLEQWLHRKLGRMILVIPRDSASEIAYYEKVLAKPDLKVEADYRTLIEQELAIAKSVFYISASDRKGLLPDDWFGFDKNQTSALRTLTTIEADPEIIDLHNIEQGKLDLRYYRRLVVPKDSEIIVKSKDDIVLASIPSRLGSILIAGNGSFLLNYPLLNHEHRKLAGAIIDLFGDSKRVVFVRTSTVIEKEAPDRSRWAFLFTPPINWIAGHLALLAIVYCAFRFPIFGRPATEETREVFRFGRHVEGLGDLLASTRNPAFARERVLQFQRSGKKEGAGGAAGARKENPTKGG